MDNLLHALEKGLSFTDKILSGGYPGRSHSQHRYAGKDYATLKHECLSSRNQFTDGDFPADSSNLLPRDKLRRVEWKRPHEISRRPRFFVDGASRFDLTQGEIGDCWLIATIANLTLNKVLFNQVVPPGQEFDRSYSGIFYFRFWCFGQWQEIVVDDKLPTYNGRLIYVRSEDPNEFWPSLLEKAYAKLQGSYGALDGGVTSDAMVHFTGGVTEMIELRNHRSNLFDLMNKGIERGSLLAASLMGSRKVKEQKLSNGLVRGHAYSITNVSWCNLASRPGHPVQLIRMRNPWGNEVEWRGPWSDRSREWSYVSAEEKRVLGVQFKKDGEFWMNFEDFNKNFDFLEMTNVNLESLKEHDSVGRLKHMWKVKKFEGSWINGASAGGCSNYSKTFPHNPKFIINLTEADDGNRDNLCTMIVALLQRPRNAKHLGSRASHPIGFCLFRVTSKVDANNLTKKFFNKYDEIKGLQDCTVCSQVSHRFNLQMGKYCLIPTTMYPGEEADFILRIFTEKSPDVINSMTETTYQPVFNMFGAPGSLLNSTPMGYPSPPAINASIPAGYPASEGVSIPQSAPYPPLQPTNVDMPYSSTQRIGTPTPAPYPLQPTINVPMPTPQAISSPYPPMPTINSHTELPYPVSSGISGIYPTQFSTTPTVNNPPYAPYPLMQTEAVSSTVPYPFQPGGVPMPGSHPPMHGTNPPFTDPFSSPQTGNNAIPPPYPNSGQNPLWTTQSPPSKTEEDETINWKRLQRMLNDTYISEFAFEGFSKAACRSIVALMDDDNSGDLNNLEMSNLWIAIRQWKSSFLQHDLDKSSSLDCSEFRAALTSTGIVISDRTMSSLLTIYGEDGAVSFDDFILCQLKLNKAMKTFLNKDSSRVGVASFKLEEYLESCL